MEVENMKHRTFKIVKNFYDWKYENNIEFFTRDEVNSFNIGRSTIDISSWGGFQTFSGKVCDVVGELV
jgi:hypothetical protein